MSSQCHIYAVNENGTTTQPVAAKQTSAAAPKQAAAMAPKPMAESASLSEPKPNPIQIKRKVGTTIVPVVRSVIAKWRILAFVDFLEN